MAGTPSFSSSNTRATRGLTAFPTTSLVRNFRKISCLVMSRGAALSTKHGEPVMVLLSMEWYLKLENAAAPNLDAHTEAIDRM